MLHTALAPTNAYTVDARMLRAIFSSGRETKSPKKKHLKNDKLSKVREHFKLKVKRKDNTV